MKCAYLYAGQGSQREKMGADLYDAFPLFRETIDRAAQVYRDERPTETGLKDLMFKSPMSELSETANTQPALAAFAAGVTAVLADAGIRPDYVAGLSLGEYSALRAAGVFDLSELIRVTCFRGKAMELAAQGIETKMCAILGPDDGFVKSVCDQVMKEGVGSVEISNYNTPSQNVISGDAAAVERAEELAKERGARRCIELKVSGAFHTRFMQPASEALSRYFKAANMRPMQIPVIFNVTGLPLNESSLTGEEMKEVKFNLSIPSEKIKDLLTLQVTHGVRMAQTIAYLKEHEVDTVIEIGPGRVLSGFVRKTVDGIDCCSIDSAEDLRDLLGRMGGNV